VIEAGRRVRLLAVPDDPYTQLQPGDVGTVSGIDSVGTIHVRWDKGGNLGLLPDVDHFEVLP
jgi:hypothetical protein